MRGVGPGTVLGGRYTVRRRLEQLHRTERWSADDTTLGRTVSVLCMAIDDHRTPALLDAARRAASVTHGVFVRILDVGSDEDVAYVVEEDLGEARTLADLVTDGGVPGDEVRRITGEVAAALESARQRGMHHLDLKPEDVLRTPDGDVRLRGLETAAVRAGEDGAEAEDAARRDAVGVVALAYAGLTGLWPLGAGGSGLAPAPRVPGGVAAPSEIAAGVPRDLDAICRLTLNDDQGPTSPGDYARQVAPWPSRQVVGRPITRSPRPAPDPDAAVGPDADTAHGADDPRRRSSSRSCPPPPGPRPSLRPARRRPVRRAPTRAGRRGSVTRRRGRGTARRGIRHRVPTADPAPVRRGTAAPGSRTSTTTSTRPGDGRHETRVIPLERRPRLAARAPRRPAGTTAGRAPPARRPRRRSSRPSVPAARRPAPQPPVPARPSPAPSARSAGGSAAWPGVPSTRSPSSAPTPHRARPRTASRRRRPRPAEPLTKDESKLALGIVAGFLVLALVIGIWGVSRIGSNSGRLSATRRPATRTTTVAPSRPPVGSASHAGDGAGAPEPLAILKVEAYDPEGDGEENNNPTPRVYDGDRARAGSPRTTAPRLRWPEEGLGVIVDLGPNKKPQSVELDVPVPATSRSTSAPTTASRAPRRSGSRTTPRAP